MKNPSASLFVTTCLGLLALDVIGPPAYLADDAGAPYVRDTDAAQGVAGAEPGHLEFPKKSVHQC